MVFLALSIVIIGAILLIAHAARPKHMNVRFTKTPPVLARINTPSANADERMRLVRLPTGDTYTIPARSRGQFLSVFEWAVPIRIDGRRMTFRVPKLSTTDFASIPRPLHSLISPLTNTIYGAILHDYLYRQPQDPIASKISRQDADRIFFWAMRVRGVHRITAGLMFLGVRLGGGKSYVR